MSLIDLLITPRLMLRMPETCSPETVSKPCPPQITDAFVSRSRRMLLCIGTKSTHLINVFKHRYVRRLTEHRRLPIQRRITHIVRDAPVATFLPRDQCCEAHVHSLATSVVALYVAVSMKLSRSSRYGGTYFSVVDATAGRRREQVVCALFKSGAAT